jgi:hypothetical protein
VPAAQGRRATAISAEGAGTMSPDPSRSGGAALCVYQGYRYTIVTIINGAQPHTPEAELWYASSLGATSGKYSNRTRSSRHASGPPAFGVRGATDPGSPGRGPAGPLGSRPCALATGTARNTTAGAGLARHRPVAASRLAQSDPETGPAFLRLLLARSGLLDRAGLLRPLRAFPPYSSAS